MRAVFRLGLALAGVLALAAGAPAEVREVNVHYRGRVEGLPLDGMPAVPAQRVKLGEPTRIVYRLTNLSGVPLAVACTSQADPTGAAKALHLVKGSVLPALVLRPHETREVPVEVVVERTLPSSLAEVMWSLRFTGGGSRR